MKKHSERKHALLSASGSSRWINCPPSAKLEEQYGEKGTSVYAAEGTLAHEISELYLRHDVLRTVDDNTFEYELEKLMANELFDEEMLDYVPVYTGYCTDELIAAKQDNLFATMEIEQELDLTSYIPESFGTADCVIINDDLMEVIDLKYGKGIPVYATNNSQGMLYALGALMKYDTLYDIERVKITIVQPRINNISTWELTVADLIDWANNTLKPAAQAAFNGEGQLKAGDWCRFCAVRNQCRELYNQQLEIAKFEFSEPALLTDEEIADVLKRTPKLVEWANSVCEYAQQRAINEKKVWPGYKLVEGVSRRKWIDDEEKVTNTIYARIPEMTEDQLFETKLKTITNVEKVVGKKKFAELLSDLTVKPQGKPTLVPDNDKRPALGIEDAINDFK